MRRAIGLKHAGAWPAEAAVGTVTLAYDERHRRRLRLVTDEGDAFLLDLEKAALLESGDGLILEDGSWVAVEAAAEDVIDAHGATEQERARLAWHLGNRHLPVQVLAGGAIRFCYDHVIEDMVRGLGARTERKKAAFTPEPGAYAANGHHHDHDHG